jgi:hypothetical protein
MNTGSITLRICLAVILAALTEGAVRAAPAPLPKKTPRVNDTALVEGLRAELKCKGIVVKDLAPVGATAWQIAVDDYRQGCHVVKGSRLIVAPNRGAALFDLLVECRRDEEQRLRRLRQLGIILD